MRLYLFQPSKKWAHCGGCVAVLAFSFEQAVETIHANEPDDVGDCHRGMIDRWAAC